MKKYLWILLLSCSMPLLTSCEEFLDLLFDNPASPYTPTYDENAKIPDNVYIADVNQPNATEYLPAPPTSESDVVLLDDKIQWEWGKTQRATNRGQIAMAHMGRSPETMCKVMAEIMGLATISKDVTPAIYRLLSRSYYTGEQSTSTAKSKYKRQRPFTIFGETAWYAADANDKTGSYTSATTAAGWAVGLAFAEMWPPLQNKFLRIAFQFGEDRVISGSNFQSDVEGGYCCGAAAYAQAHLDEKFQNDIVAARDEYKRLLGVASTYDPTAGIGIPNGVSILNAPLNTSDSRYQADLMRYYEAKKLRDTNRGQQAVMDADANTENLAKIFGGIIGITISPSTTPAIYNLMEMIRPNNATICQNVKLTYFRLRPFAQLGEATPLPAKEPYYKTQSSYPSGHTCYAWAVGLMLAEVAPPYQNQILARAYVFGDNRVVVGYHWPTDVDAGRILAASLIANLQTSAEFRNLIKQGQAEYKNQKK